MEPEQMSRSSFSYQKKTNQPQKIYLTKKNYSIVVLFICINHLKCKEKTNRKKYIIREGSKPKKPAAVSEMSLCFTNKGFFSNYYVLFNRIFKENDKHTTNII